MNLILNVFCDYLSFIRVHLARLAVPWCLNSVCRPIRSMSAHSTNRMLHFCATDLQQIRERTNMSFTRLYVYLLICIDLYYVHSTEHKKQRNVNVISNVYILLCTQHIYHSYGHVLFFCVFILALQMETDIKYNQKTCSSAYNQNEKRRPLVSWFQWRKFHLTSKEGSLWLRNTQCLVMCEWFSGFRQSSLMMVFTHCSPTMLQWVWLLYDSIGFTGSLHHCVPSFVRCWKFTGSGKKTLILILSFYR